MESRLHSFHDKFVLGGKLGEGQHASVYKCFKRVNPRRDNECSTPLLADKLAASEYFPQPYAVKIVRDDDREKILAHQKEFEILLKLNHGNIVKAIELFSDEFKHEIF